jgi:hypothetical protein
MEQEQTVSGRIRFNCTPPTKNGDKEEKMSLAELERQINGLPYDERLLLMERLIRTLRSSTNTAPEDRKHMLAAMAADPDIQREIQAINSEFAVTEADGLE